MIKSDLIYYISIYGLGTMVTIIAGGTGLYLSMKKNIVLPSYLLHLFLLIPIYYLVLQLLKYDAHKNYVDFTASTEIIYNIIHGRGAYCSIQESFVPGSGRWFSSHFTPYYYLFAPAFALFNTPKVLIVTQFLLLITAVPAIYIYSKDKFSSKDDALIIAICLILYPTYQYIHLYGIEMLRLCIPLLIITFFFLERGNKLGYWIFLILSLLAREEVGLSTFFLGLYIFFYMKQRRLGLATSFVSLAYTLLMIEVIMPSLRTGIRTDHIASHFISHLGTSMGEIVIGIISHPSIVLKLILEPIKLASIFIYFLPLIFLPLFAWPVVLITLGNVGVNLLSVEYAHTSYFLYYLSPTVAFIFIALVKGIQKYSEILVVKGWVENIDRGRSTALTGLFFSAFTANIFFGPSPFSLQFWFKDYKLAPFNTLDFHYSEYIATEHDRRLKDVINIVPQSARISAEQHLLPFFYDRAALKVFPDTSNVDYIIIDKKWKKKKGVTTVGDSYEGLRKTPQFYYDWVEKDQSNWELIRAIDGYFIFRKINNVHNSSS